jgi:polyhydroxyalkanoate synthesis repressor PhaR
MMVAIKRYPNRKLYNTETKEYISLDGLAELIRLGDEIMVTDNASGEDLTALTLTQIILAQEKKQNGVLPHSALTNLIRAGGDRLSALQRGLLAPLGLWGQVDEEIKARIQALVAEGELSEAEGAELVEKLVDAGQKIRVEGAAREAADRQEGKGTSFAEVEAYVRKHQLPSQQDVLRLEEQLAELEAKLEEITHSRQGLE